MTLLERGENLVKSKFIATDPKYTDDAVSLADDLTCITITHLSNYVQQVLRDDPVAKKALVILTTKIIDLEIAYAEQGDIDNNGILSIKKE